MTDFVHLRVHSEYSLVDSVVRVRPLIERAGDCGMPAVALTDQGNVSGAVKFYRAARDRGIKPIIGADLWLTDGAGGEAPSRLTLLCADRHGYENLSRLLTLSYTQVAADGRALLPKACLDEDALAGLIALSGAQHGELGRALGASRPERAAEVLEYWQGLMPERFYVELQRLGRPGENDYLRRAVQLAAARRVPLLATNEVCFLEAGEFQAHETRVCIGQGRTLSDPKRPRDHSEQQYFKSADEMQALFADIPEALANTVEVAKRCSFEFDLDSVYMPRFETSGDRSARQELYEQAERGLAERLRVFRSESHGEQVYAERLARELEVISEMGFEGYFLIVADFIRWSRDNGIPVGPGRGSGAGSLVAYALGITNLDPIVHELLFERFLNPERVSLPDFDIDFCIQGRDRVIDYVGRRYGRDRVSQIVTFGTMAARAVVRDVGRAFGMPYGYVDRIAKLIPFEIGITLDKALDTDDELRAAYDAEEDVKELIDLAKQLEGLARNVGTHAGGVVIAPEPLTKFMPLYADSDNASLTQLDKDDLEAIGLVKFDFLGLKTLTIIDRALATINRLRAAGGEPPIDIDAIDADDAETYALLNRCQTAAVFQLESRGMRDLIKRLQPDCFEDLVAVLALFRPGPLQSGMVDEFIDRKHGRNTAPVDYLHPSLESILKPTYGVILYQEQVMQIAQLLAGYSLGGADLLRRAMGKKKPEEMSKQREIFLAGAAEHGVDAKRAAYIFDLMEKFAGYGFNRSHSAAYALIAYQTAWLKAHYPEAFMAAVLTADMDNTDKLVSMLEDCRQLGIEIDPPNVNRSEHGFAAGDGRRIAYGLGAIKGVGRAVVEAIVAERDANGPYDSMLDLCRRLDQHKLNRRVLEALVSAGALDGLGQNRATLFAAIPDTLALADRSAQASAAGQGALFGGEESTGELAHLFAPVRDWSKRERLNAEEDSLGLCLTGHHFDDYSAHCRALGARPIGDVLGGLPSEADRFRARESVTLAGVAKNLRRRGGRLVFDLDDNTGLIEVSLFDEVYERSKHLIGKNAALVVEGQLKFDDFLSAWRLTARTVHSADAAIEEHAARITIQMNGAESGAEFVGELRATLEPFRRGNCQVAVLYRGPAAQAELTFGDDWAVRPTRELRERLGHLLGEERFSIHYQKKRLG